ncbi:TPA: hypothetical protein N0F65_001597 [Lagenidium giganteum]|uniref:Uncharacterized protein n=1 Tax=Lagenidium giganteum TaxID=4803 RepID=A0AAV2Z322_9STRA|nr:TPA: hypothetical protein N0F65_001597 [Lagenidium giganteum]
MVRKVLQAQNIMRPLVMIAIVGNIINVITGYYLGYHTSMGFHGIALSRTLGNIVLPLLLLPYFACNPTHLTQWWSEGWNLREAADHVGLFLRLGVPGMLMLVMEWWAYEMLALMAGVLPDSVVAVSAQAVLMNVVSMLFMVFLGISVAGNIRVGNCLGANQPRRARLVSRMVLSLVFFVSTIMALGVFFLHDWIPTLLVNDAVSIEQASHALMVWAPFEIIEGLNCVTQGVYRGCGKQDLAAKTNAIAYYIVGIPIAAFLAFQLDFGIEGLWLGFGAGLSVSVVTLLYILKRSCWQQLAREARERTAQ